MRSSPAWDRWSPSPPSYWALRAPLPSSKSAATSTTMTPEVPRMKVFTACRTASRVGVQSAESFLNGRMVSQAVVAWRVSRLSAMMPVP